MTVEAAVMNSRAVAIAADSAVTFGGSGKVFYTAEKIFQLHKDLPIGIMIYASTTFMGAIDWEVIIKEYTKYLNGKSFDTLGKHAEHFIDFVRDYKYINDEMERNYFDEFVGGVVFGKVLNNVVNIYKENKDKEKRQLFDEIIGDSLTAYKDRFDTDAHKKDMIDDYFLELNLKRLDGDIERAFKEHIGEDISDKQKDTLKALIRYTMMDICTDEESEGRYLLNPYVSGIVFAGYGEKEIFPAICRCIIYGKLGKNFISNVTSGKIDSSGESNVIPFAQTDVINLFVNGIDDGILEHIRDKFMTISETAKKKLSEEGSDELVKMCDEALGSITNYITTYLSDPIYNIIAHLPGINLAEIAESLVNITSLRRHNSTEGDTVGGPTDVALITKGDGFKWIRNKNGIR